MIKATTIENAIYELCVQANTDLSVYSQIKDADNPDYDLILENAKLAHQKKEPLCQDTGQVLVFIEIGQDVQLDGDLKTEINNGVKKAYGENFYRKSVVKNAIFDRTNTKDNTPAIIYIDVVSGDKIRLDVLIKGAGAENMSEAKMLSPTASEPEIIDFIVEVIEKSGTNACPPLFVGIGVGGTLEYAGLLSKKALLLDKNIDEQHENFAIKIKTKSDKALDIKILTSSTHIACMPVAVTLNCHSSRHASAQINAEGNIEYLHNDLDLFQSCTSFNPEILTQFNAEERLSIHTSEVNKIKALEKGQKILLSGEIYTARDVAHEKLTTLINEKKALPFDIKDKIIFYAGPCPAPPSKIIGSIGPTTASRMDKFAPILYENGLLATIGKGERSDNIGGIYFSMQGGIACYIAQNVFKSEIIAFEELGPESVYKLEVANVPLTVE